MGWQHCFELCEHHQRKIRSSDSCDAQISETRDVSGYPYPVLQYTSFNTTKIAGYRLGNPIASPTAAHIAEHDIDIIHTHCPAVSSFLARLVREKKDVPIVFTYHTKFDIDIARFLLRKIA